jgi:hypothetical protein
MQRDPDGPNDLGLVVGVVAATGDGRPPFVGLQVGRTRWALTLDEARGMAQAFTEAADLLESGGFRLMPSVDGRTATATDVTRALERAKN